MKKASFFIVLGLAVLLLFGCAGGGGVLGGVSTKPEGIWLISTYMDPDGDEVDQEFDSSFYIKISVNEAKDAYDAKAEDEEGNELAGITVTFDFSNDKVNSLKIKRGNDYDFNLTGEFYDGSSKTLDVMLGTYDESKHNEEGIWVAFRKGSPYLAGVSTSESEGDNLKQLETRIERLIKETTGKEVKIDFSEIIK